MNLMIWGCITYEGMGTITIENGNINAAKYIDILLAIFQIMITYTKMTMLLYIEPELLKNISIKTKLIVWNG